MSDFCWQSSILNAPFDLKSYNRADGLSTIIEFTPLPHLFFSPALSTTQAANGAERMFRVVGSGTAGTDSPAMRQTPVPYPGIQHHAAGKHLASMVVLNMDQPLQPGTQFHLL